MVVVNAGIARVAAIVDEEAAGFRELLEVNQVGAFLTLREAGRRMIAQGLGGAVVLVSSKNVLGPGADFGAYSASKAGAHQLARVAALEWAAHGVRVNMVCPDAVFRHGAQESGLWKTVAPARARSRGVEVSELEDYYTRRNLMKRTIRAEDVGRAVLFFAAETTPTTGALLRVDGGVASAMPR